MANDKEQGKALNWDSEVEHDGAEWTLLPEGVYPFVVQKFERAHYGGSQKPGGLPPCPQAKLTIEIGDAEQATTIEHNLFLHTRCEGMLCQFFRAIGARKHGERVVMNWANVVGATGKAKVSVRKWAKREEKQLPPDKWTGESNEIKKFLDPEEAAGTDAAAPAQDLAF